DASKAHLDVAARPGTRFRVANDPDGLAELVARLRPLAPSLVVLEATGGDEAGAPPAPPAPPPPPPAGHPPPGPPLPPPAGPPVGRRGRPAPQARPDRCRRPGPLRGGGRPAPGCHARPRAGRIGRPPGPPAAVARDAGGRGEPAAARPAGGRPGRDRDPRRL